MGILKDIKLGLRSYKESVKFVVKHKMWLYFVAPIILFGGIYYFGFQMDDYYRSAMKSLDGAGFFGTIWGSIKVAFFGALSYLFLQLTRYIMLVVLSPILAIVSEKVEKVITGNVYKLNMKQLMKDVGRAIKIAIRNITYELIFIAGVWIVLHSSFAIFGARSTTVPFLNEMKVVDLMFLILSSLIAFYFYGFGFIDYVMERRRMSIKESIKFVRKHKGVAIALGSLFVMLFHSIALIDYFDAGIVREVFKWVTAFLASTIPIFTAIAATLAMHELVDLKSNEFAIRKEIRKDIGVLEIDKVPNISDSTLAVGEGLPDDLEPEQE
jgi:CysZ protein